MAARRGHEKDSLRLRVPESNRHLQTNRRLLLLCLWQQRLDADLGVLRLDSRHDAS
jgi:hypothetical protein